MTQKNEKNDTRETLYAIKALFASVVEPTLGKAEGFSVSIEDKNDKQVSEAKHDITRMFSRLGIEDSEYETVVEGSCLKITPHFKPRSTQEISEIYGLAGKKVPSTDSTRVFLFAFEKAVQPVLGQTRDFHALGDKLEALGAAVDRINRLFASLGADRDEYKIQVSGIDPSFQLEVIPNFRLRTQEELSHIGKQIPYFDGKSAQQEFPNTDNEITWQRIEGKRQGRVDEVTKLLDRVKQSKEAVSGQGRG